MRDAILVIDVGGAREAEVAIEALEVGLRRDPDRDGAGRREPALHQLPAEALPAMRRRDHHPADRELVIAHAGRQDAQVRRDRVALAVAREHVARGRIEAVDVGVRAALLDHEHLRAQREDGVELAELELLESPVVPGEGHRRAVYRLAVQRVCVFLSSSDGLPSHAAAIDELARELARRQLALVYGGAHRGLMGVLADAMLAAGGAAIGVIPRALVELEVAHRGLSELHVVDTMHQRKALMFTLADGFVVGPGGFGTLEEAFETLTGLQLGYHGKPMVFLDVDGFWSPLEAFLDHAVATGVLRAEVRALFRTASTPAAALDLLAAW